MEAKKQLAGEIVATYHGRDARAESAATNGNARFSEKRLDDDRTAGVCLSAGELANHSRRRRGLREGFRP